LLLLGKEVFHHERLLPSLVFNHRDDLIELPVDLIDGGVLSLTYLL
jgi:hypothetical protein